MSEWTATARANATPGQVLQVLTHPEEIRRWSPVDFDLDDLDGRRLAAGSRGRVTGRLAGVPIGFDVEIHSADEARLELSAEGPVALDVRYDLSVDDAGAELSASVSLRASGGLRGRLVANATAALLSAGALEGAAGRIARVAESQPVLAESQPVLAESQPVLAESQPVLAESQPVLAESQPVLAESQPVLAAG